MKNYWLNFIKKIIGILLIIGGILGLFLPFFQGIAMILVGAIFLNNKFILNRVKAIRSYLKQRM